MKAEFQIFGSPGKDEMRKWTLEVLAKQMWKNEIFRSPDRAEVRKAELHIFGSPGRDEMWKWTYPYLEVLVEQVRKKNESSRSPGRAEVRKAELLIFGS